MSLKENTFQAKSCESSDNIVVICLFKISVLRNQTHVLYVDFGSVFYQKLHNFCVPCLGCQMKRWVTFFLPKMKSKSCAVITHVRNIVCSDWPSFERSNRKGVIREIQKNRDGNSCDYVTNMKIYDWLNEE